MWIRKAVQEDFPAVRKLAAALGLEFAGMETAPFWLAEEDGRILGIVALLAHSDCRELVSLGVSPEARKSGLGGRLIEAVMDAAGTDVYLATVIPGYFERHGFLRSDRIPPGMAKDPAWCELCDRRLCVVMVRKKS
jgi:N-acetylglutamate synthase-like GNAT family acetyltransferase